ncbi:pyrroline-5-carboxylate reductase dimerization domain-containing protein [Sphingomonas arenae]|uniref:pyrroline-5-carboxylate reductase dimerization domain-containing protein n=1 Tax=Sphingomonas arenae TaxID=2812555 RepID=UPI00196784FE
MTAIWFVGCGNMAGAMVEGWRKSGFDFSNAVAIRPSGTPVEGVRTVAALPEGPAPRLVVLGFKPQKLNEVAPELRARLGPETIVISLLAGAEAKSLRGRFPEVRAIIRAMPNLPVSERMGVTALYSEDANEDLRTEVGDWIGLLGLAHWCETQAEFGAIGSVAGSGPAFVARFIAALAKAGEGLGLEGDFSLDLTLRTVAGTAAMAQSRCEDMASIARRVASPRGTTEAGLSVLDGEDALQGLLARTLEASQRRGRELAEAARAIDSPPSVA